ncbi:MAG: hypothetical protein MJ192_03070 [Clostridia bacterium]|nr:hypothetical protein [Clostridia bacterium]
MKPTTRLTSILLTLTMLLGMVSLCTVPAADGGEGLSWSGTPITHHEGSCDYLDSTLTTHIFDFSVDSISYYATDRTVAYNGTPVLEDGRVTNRPGHTFTFGSALCLGDEYGLEEGYASFDLCLRAGKVSMGVRNTRTCSTPDKRGIWFDFTPGTLTVREPDSGLSVDLTLAADLSAGQTIRVYEGLSNLTLTVGGETVCVISYTRGGGLAVCGADGTELAKTENNTVEPTGYFSIHLEELDGWIDNVIYTSVSETRKEQPAAGSLRKIDYSTWTATDAIGRTVSGNASVGDPKEKRDVGVFYFLCWVGAGQHVTDNTLLYSEGGIEGVKSHYAQTVGESYWGEPFFGYYRNTDTWVYRKHAYQLEAAGVDFIFLDVSNAEVFIEGHMALFNTWLEMRHEGIDTPQICFFNGDSGATFESNMKKLFTTVYSDENWSKYEELFYLWDGKPLVFGNLSGVSLGMKQTIQNKFTVRGNWAWCDKNNYWSWMQEYIVTGSRAKLQNGGWGRSADGTYESLSVALGHHATQSKGRSFVNNRQADNKLGDYEYSSIERSGQGLCFANEFKAVQMLMEKEIKADQPFCLLITGWNEWIAGGTRLDAPTSFCNGQADFQYVDNFNAEFSRDAEPMRNRNGYGFGDNYYYQMVDVIRQYKGISATPAADNQTTVSIYDLSGWDNISMTYMDSLYDVEHRNTISYDADYRYINNSGRNDLDTAKVSQDDNNLYFLVTCADDVIIDDGPNWMNLFLDTDNDPATGWNGFDYVLNRARDSFAVTVEKITDADFHTETVGGAYYAVQGNTMTVRLPKELLGLSGTVTAMNFKWADNSVDTTAEKPDPMDFMDHGDTAPDSRFAFVYLCESCTTTAEAPVTLATDAYTTQTAQIPAVPTDLSYETKLGSRDVDYLFDAEHESAGIYVTDSALADYFQHVGGNSSSKVQIVKQSGKENKYMKMTGYSDLRTWNDVKGSYEMSVDLHMIDVGNSAVYVRGEMPGSLSPVNPRNFNVYQVFNYFEWDWYAENGGRKFGGSSTAGSGIGIYPTEDSLILRVKRYASDGLTVASASHTFAYPASYEVGGDGWFNLHVLDDGTTVSILCNDTLICTVKLEQPGVTYESDGTGQEYYGLATVFDADGKEVLKVENTRLNSAGSQIAVTTRDQTMEFDNIYIRYTELLVEGNHVVTPFNPVLTEVEYTPDTRLVSTLYLGKLPEVVTEPETVPADDPAATEPDGSGTTADGSGCKSLLTLAALPLVLTAAALVRRKRED